MKRITITVEQLQKLNACQSGIDWFITHKVNSLRPLVEALLEDNRADYARWLLSRLMTHPQRVKWAIYSTEQVIKIFEKKYPTDKRPRLAIKAAKDFLAGKITKEAASAAASAAYAASAAADAAASAARQKLNRKLMKFALKLLGV